MDGPSPISIGPCNMYGIKSPQQYVYTPLEFMTLGASRVTPSFLKVSTGRKTATIGVVGLRTDREYRPVLFLWCKLALTHYVETNNEMSKDDSYEHISVMQNIGQYVLLDELTELSTENYQGCLCQTCGDFVRRLSLARPRVVMVCCGPFYVDNFNKSLTRT